MTSTRTTHRVVLAFLAALTLLAWTTGAAAQSGAVVEYYHLDALGSVRAVTDANGTLLRRHEFLPFGEEHLPPVPQPDVRLFTGKERDTQTGLDYFGARYYRADIGRFTTVDPAMTLDENLVDPQRWNRYSYVRNNPLRYVDPDGRFPILVALAQAIQRVASSPTAQRAASWAQTQGVAAWTWATRFFNSPGGMEAVTGLASASAGADIPGPGGVGAYNRHARSGIAVIGRFAAHGPDCHTTFAKSIGAHYFEIGEEIWNAMTPAARDAANMKFIQRVAAEGEIIQSNLDLRQITHGALFREIQELLKLGYTFGESGRGMLPPKR